MADLTGALGEAHAVKRGGARALAWGFADLEQLRVGYGRLVSPLCRVRGLPARAYYDDRPASYRARQHVCGPVARRPVV